MWFQLIYVFLGGLGLFFFGIKMLSESLQSIAGDLIRRIINALTTNRLIAVGVGALVTTIVQSSSVTTVMIVGLANANLITLTQAMGVIFGANIGTTITGWIIAIKVGKYGLLLVGLGIFPHLFAKGSKARGIGKLLIALGFVFMGLEFMSQAFKPLRHTEQFQHLLVYFSASSFPTLLACIGVGTLITCMVQSSSAMLGVTMALGATGSITFQTAAALVLGENIGTTITALLASVNTNRHAKRAARAHAIFNILGVCWLTPLFWVYLQAVDWVIPGMPDFVDAEGGKPYIAAHIAFAHTLFNVCNTLVFLPILGPMARFISWITPAREEKESSELRFLPAAIGSSPPMALMAAEKELINLSGIVLNALDWSREYVRAREPDPGIAEKVRKYEVITDSIQTEITVFLCHTQEARLTPEQTSRAYGLIRAADELESIADYCNSLTHFRDRLSESGQELGEGQWRDLAKYFGQVLEFYVSMQVRIGTRNWDLRFVYAEDQKLKEEGNRINDSHRRRLEGGGASPIAGMLFSDMVVNLRKIRGHVINAAEALSSVPLMEQKGSYGR